MAPQQNAPAPAQAAPAPAVPLLTAPVANVTVAQPTAAPATAAPTQPPVAQVQPVPTNSQIQYAQPGECKYHWNYWVSRWISFSSVYFAVRYV